MRLLADECCDRPLVSALRAAGHDVRYVLEGDAGTSDAALLVLASEEDRILLTDDKDFGDLAVRQRKAVPGVILIRIAASDPGRIPRVLLVIANAESRLHGSYTVVQRERIRFRPLG